MEETEGKFLWFAIGPEVKSCQADTIPSLATDIELNELIRDDYIRYWVKNIEDIIMSSELEIESST